MVIIEITVLLLRVYRSGSSGNTSCWFSREESDIDNESRARYNQIRQEIQKGHVLRHQSKTYKPIKTFKNLYLKK